MPTVKAYGRAHQRARAALLPLAYGQPCPICKMPMEAWQHLDLGHSTHEAKTQGLPGDRIEHASCNRANADLYGHNQPSPQQPWHSRQW